MCAILCHSASSIMMPHSVILNGVKNLLSDNTLSPLSMVGFEEMLRFRSA